MSEKQLAWRVPLGAKPEIVTMGRATHGHEPMERFYLPGIWCLHFYTYRAGLTVDGTSLEILPGNAGLVPPGARLEYRFGGPSEHLYVLLRLRRTTHESDWASIPAMLDLGQAFESSWNMLEEAIGYFSTSPLRAEVRVWDLLWRLASMGTQAVDAPAGSEHDAVRFVREHIERHLASSLRVPQIASLAGISHNHLIRLFRSQLGDSVVGYIRKRRVQRARELLVYSTLPVKVIASEVGIPDLHLFNKTIRRELGHAPRAIRGR